MRATDRRSARASAREEKTAVKAYKKRISKAESPKLKAVLKHNLSEEREHLTALKAATKKGKKR